MSTWETANTINYNSPQTFDHVPLQDGSKDAINAFLQVFNHN